MTDAQKKALALARARLKVKNDAPQAITPEQRAANVAGSADRQAEINANVLKEIAPPPGMAATAMIGAAQGTTMGFADEIAARIVSMDPNITYDDALATARQKLDAGRKENPKTAMASELAGAVALPVGAMGTGGKIGWRVAKGAATGAGLSGLYGFGSGEGGFKSRALAGAKSMPLGAALGGAVPVVGAGLQKFLNSRAGRALSTPTSFIDRKSVV